MEFGVKFGVLLLLAFVSNTQQFSLQETGAIPMTTYVGKSYNKTYYMPHYFQATWMGAYQFCKSSGMQLVTFDTEEEYKFFFDFVNKNAKTYSSTYAVQLIYVGSTNSVLGSKTGWVAYDTGIPVTFPYIWGSGQPNNAAGDQLCLSFILEFSGVYDMNDYSCYGDFYIAHFACQIYSGNSRGYKKASG